MVVLLWILLWLPCPIAVSAITNNSSSNNRRQLELCLVAVLRLTAWTEHLVQQWNIAIAATAASPMESSRSTSTTTTTTNILEQRKIYYVEARLGAKAALTSKVGSSGANAQVYQLSTLQLRGCLHDLMEYAAVAATTTTTTTTSTVSSSYASMTIQNTILDLNEALASLVEFDGLDNLLDPSPRSSLALAQFSAPKETYVRRVLQERILPTSYKLLQQFGSVPLQRSVDYLQIYYPNEIPSQFRKKE